MAAVYGMQAAKHKSVYGKKGARAYNVNSFFDEDEDEQSTTKNSVKSAYPVKKTEVKGSARTLKPVKPRIKRQDTFDVPSSSDDDVSPPTKRVAPLKPRSVAADDTDTSGVQPFAWEKRKQQTPPRQQSPIVRRQRTPEGSPEAQLKHELRQATQSPESSPRTPRLRNEVSQQSSQVASPDSGAELKVNGAAARLAARRKLLESNTPSSADERTKPARVVPKRPVIAGDEAEDTPRKRARTISAKQERNEDVEMADVDANPVCNIEQPSSNRDNDASIYDFPDPSEEVPKQTKPTSKAGQPSAKLPRRRKQVQIHSSRPLQKKGASAPSRLAEMIATDTDTTEPSTRSPSESPSLTSVQKLPSTPPSARISSPDTAVKTGHAMTPKQAQLWDRLLPGNPAVPSPSALALRDLTISGERRKAVPVPAARRRLSKSQSDLPKRRPRLVDRLKASAPSSDIEADDDQSDDTSMVDEEDVGQPTNPTITDPSTTHRPSVSRSQSQAESQSRSQSQATASVGSLRTYAMGARSHLDDSIDDIMVGFTGGPAEEPAQTSRFGKKPALNSQKSTFDMDDSDDDQASNSQMRSVHELRAAGSLSRGMWEIEEALEEIKQRAQTQRGRRRTALMDLATKLSDKTFATRFLGQSCEFQLAAECSAGADEIADFIIAAAIALILASEPSTHTLEGLTEQGVITWLAGLLKQDTQVIKLARDRKNNMSKASQMSLAQFCDMLKSLPTLWDEDKPQVISPRLIALKALDQLARRLRKSGDKSEILAPDSLVNVLPAMETTVGHSVDIDLALSISLLESLSTAALSLDWPTSTIENIRALLPTLQAISSMARNSLYLLVRLCLNLTNENARNCALLVGADDSVVRFLLTAISTGYEKLASETDDGKRTVALDVLLLTIGITINLAEHSDSARSFAVANTELLSSLIEIFQLGQKHMLDAESVEESLSNVTFGWLAIMLANLCQDAGAKAFIVSKLSGRDLSMLVDAVEEFVQQHQRVDKMNAEKGESVEFQGAFTEKLKFVLARLKGEEGMVDV